MRLPERHDVVRRPEHVREADVLAPEALIGPDDPLGFLAILGKGEGHLVAEQLRVERAAQRRRGNEVDLVGQLHAGLVGETGACLLRVVRLRAAAARDNQRAGQDRAKKEPSASHAEDCRRRPGPRTGKRDRKLQQLSSAALLRLCRLGPSVLLAPSTGRE
jgi:hypothetical protein